MQSRRCACGTGPARTRGPLPRDEQRPDPSPSPCRQCGANVRARAASQPRPRPCRPGPPERARRRTAGAAGSAETFVPAMWWRTLAAPLPSNSRPHHLHLYRVTVHLVCERRARSGRQCTGRAGAHACCRTRAAPAAAPAPAPGAPASAEEPAAHAGACGSPPRSCGGSAPTPGARRGPWARLRLRARSQARARARPLSPASALCAATPRPVLCPDTRQDLQARSSRSKFVGGPSRGPGGRKAGGDTRPVPRVSDTHVGL